MIRLAWMALLLALVTPRVAAGTPAQGARDLDAQALAAYRAEDWDGATALWTAALDRGDVSDRERARWMTNLGNAAARRDDWTRAAAWFEASLRLRPRDGATREKLEYARSEAGWPPLDRGDLASTTARLLGALTADEARWLALLGLLPLAGALAGEALRGGRAWRRAAWVALALWALTLAPCVHRATRTQDALLVTAPGGAAARAEPRDTAERLERLPAGSYWRRLDALPGWVKLAGPDGREAWAPEGDLFALDR